ncbi:MAG: hypothetical protein P1U34_04875 [Coxiellaceae bacterium]|nr:hypothetical protein [Coxiellaceae bacterium]
MSRNFSHAPLLQAASKISHIECDEAKPLHYATHALQHALAKADIDYAELLHLSGKTINLITDSLDLPTIHDASDMPAALSTIDSDRLSNQNTDLLISAIRLLMQHDKNTKAASTATAKPRLFTEGKTYQTASKLLKYCHLHANPLYNTNAAKLHIITTTPSADKTDLTQQTKDLLFNILDTLGITTPNNTSDIPACEAYLLSTDTTDKPLLLNALRWLQGTMPPPDTHTAPSATPKHT